jgi:crossover junction endodeoxyribonuclease RusA
MTITLPLPKRTLSPNARTHWRAKAQVTRMARQVARLRTLEALGGRPAPALTTYTLEFYFRTARKRDDDNWAAACKAYRDGIADALGIDDHALRMSASPVMAIDRANPRLVVTLAP